MPRNSGMGFALGLPILAAACVLLTLFGVALWRHELATLFLEDWPL